MDWANQGETKQFKQLSAACVDVYKKNHHSRASTCVKSSKKILKTRIEEVLPRWVQREKKVRCLLCLWALDTAQNITFRSRINSTTPLSCPILCKKHPRSSRDDSRERICRSILYLIATLVLGIVQNYHPDLAQPCSFQIAVWSSLFSLGDTLSCFLFFLCCPVSDSVLFH